MATSIPSLWPDDIRVDVLVPLVILKVQAEQLGRITQGILKGSIESTATDHEVVHALVAIAPAYNSYRAELLSVSHGPDLPYPATVEWLDEAKDVADDTELSNALHAALRSPHVRGTISSLIANSNQARNRDTPG